MAPFAVFAIALIIQSAPGENLVENPHFYSGMQGWSEIWCRDAGAATAKLVNEPDGRPAVVVRSTGQRDWSFAQSANVPAHPGDIFRIGAQIQCDEEGDAETSVVLRDGSGNVLEWSYGAAKVGTKGGWRRLSRRLVAPPKTASLQYRFLGYGPGAFHFRDAELMRVGSIAALGKGKLQEVSVRNERLAVVLTPDGALTLTSGENVWKTAPVVTSPLIAATATGDSIQATYWDVANDVDRTVSYKLEGGELEVTVDGRGAVADGLALPGPALTKPGDWLIVPMNEGILYPVDEKEIPTMTLVAYGGHGICMPWFGVESPGSGRGLMTILETPDDASVRLERPGDRLQIAPLWDSSRGQLGYARRLRMVPFSGGGYVAMTQRYRAYAKEHGLLVTLQEKRKQVPAVDRLVGAVNIWSTTGDQLNLCHEMKALGMDRVLWSGGGSAEQIRTINAMGYLSSRYDIFQDVWDPKTSLSWMNHKGWPDDLVLLKDGSWMKGWAHPDKQPDGSINWIQGGVICSERAIERAKEVIPEELGRIPYKCRFIDTTTATPWRECYNPLHPLTRSEDRRFKMGLLSFCSKDEGLVVGSETGVDASVPYLDYFEGMMSLGMYRLPDAGTDMIGYRKPTPEFLKFQVGSYYRLPLWELVYHDCTVAQWYWGDASNKAPEVWDRRDLLNILYGTAPLFYFDDRLWQRDQKRMVQTYRNVCEWARKVGYEPMVSHEFLSEDHNVQRTRWKSGRWAVVNFEQSAATVNGQTVAPMGFLTGD